MLQDAYYQMALDSTVANAIRDTLAKRIALLARHPDQRQDSDENLVPT